MFGRHSAVGAAQTRGDELCRRSACGPHRRSISPCDRAHSGPSSHGLPRYAVLPLDAVIFLPIAVNGQRPCVSRCQRSTCWWRLCSRPGSRPKWMQLVQGKARCFPLLLPGESNGGGRRGAVICSRWSTERGDHRRDLRPEYAQALSREMAAERDDRNGRRGLGSGARGCGCGGAFGTRASVCTATSRLVVHERVHDHLVKMCAIGGAGCAGFRVDAPAMSVR